MVKVSISVRMNTYYKREDGKSALYLQVIINRKKFNAPLNLHWYAHKFDKYGSFCQKSEPNCQDYSDYNMIIRDCIGKANDIFKYYRLSNIDITLEKFKEEYYQDNAKGDFIKYFEYALNKRRNKNHITKRTYQSHYTCLLRLKEKFKTLPFCEIRTDFPMDFESFLRKEYNNMANTVHGRHKTVKAYMNLAITDGIYFTNPYNHFKLHKMQGNWRSLSRQELKEINTYYNKMAWKSPNKTVLRRFLFSCFTGLRLSDLKNLNQAHITERYLVIKIFKTRKKDRILHLPLSIRAKELLEEEKNLGDYHKLFNRCSDQLSNRRLTAIGIELNFKVKLHHHIGRETFATLYLEGGGKIEVLKEYMDHADIQTTMKYVHISEERKLNEINMIDQFL